MFLLNYPSASLTPFGSQAVQKLITLMQSGTELFLPGLLMCYYSQHARLRDAALPASAYRALPLLDSKLHSHSPNTTVILCRFASVCFQLVSLSDHTAHAGTSDSEGRAAENSTRSTSPVSGPRISQSPGPRCFSAALQRTLLKLY